MICVKFTAFCDLRVDLRIRLATLRKSVRKFWFCKLALTCVDLRVRLARALGCDILYSIFRSFSTEAREKKAVLPTAESKAIKILANNITEQEESEELRERWILTANVFNRFFTWLFLFSIIITLLAVFAMDSPTNKS